MKNSKKALALILSLLMLAGCAVSCSENGSEDGNSESAAETAQSAIGGDESESETEEERLRPNIPESADYGDDEILFLFWEVSDWSGTVRECRDIFSEGLNGEGINDAVYNRNIKIEEAYGVKILLQMELCGNVPGIVTQEITSGGNTYDVIYPRLLESPALYQKGYFHNLYNVEYIDLSQPWWDSNSVESLTCKGYLPCAATSINLNDKDATSAVAFNKTIAGNNQLEDIYSLVREGKWTYDKLSQLSEASYSDTNGDGVMTQDDVYGLLGKNDVMCAFYYGCGSVLAGHDDEGGFKFTFGSERDINAAVEVVKLMNQTWFMNHQTAGLDDIQYRELFETGHGLFFWMRLDEVTNMRNGDADFGIIPTPKYEETQSDYWSMVSQHTTGLLSIPITQSGDALSEIGLVLEAMAAESHYTLIPEYIETSLKTKNARDAESADMLDIIINHRVFDPMLIYNFGGFADSFMSLGAANRTDIASFVQKSVKVIDKSIGKTVDAMVEASGNQ